MYAININNNITFERWQQLQIPTPLPAVLNLLKNLTVNWEVFINNISVLGLWNEGTSIM